MLWHLLSDLIPGDADRDCNNYFMSCAHVHFVKMVYFIVKLFVHFVGDYSEMHAITHMLQIPVYYCQQFMCIRCLCSCMCCTETALTLCCCTVITSLLVVNGSLVCWFCLVLFQWFFLPGRMWTQCVWPSLRTLDVILSTWSLHYLPSSAILPSRCSATWNAWLASSLKPSGNCVLKRCRRFVLSLPSSHECRSHKKIPQLGWLLLLLTRQENTQNTLQPPATAHLSQLLLDLLTFTTLQKCRTLHVNYMDVTTCLKAGLDILHMAIRSKTNF